MRKNKGFTLIELMIVIAIIAIIAAIAIPNLLQSRIRANESNAVSQVRNYAAAQSIFQERDCGLLLPNLGAGFAAISRNAYTSQYDLLYYGNPVVGAAGGAPAASADILRLINIAHANATLAPSAALTAAGATTQEFNGYWFIEPGDAPAGFYANRYAQLGFPTNAARSGSKAYYFDDNGTVMSFLLVPAATAAATAAGQATPAEPTGVGAAGWAY